MIQRPTMYICRTGCGAFPRTSCGATDWEVPLKTFAFMNKRFLSVVSFLPPPPYLGRVCNISTRATPKIMETQTQIEPAAFYWNNLRPWPRFPAVTETSRGWITPTDSEGTTKAILWPPYSSTSAADITTFHATHSGFLCSWASQTRFKYLPTLSSYRGKVLAKTIEIMNPVKKQKLFMLMLSM